MLNVVPLTYVIKLTSSAAPQPTTRDKLIASVRRNSRLAYLKAAEASASASASASAAAQTLSDQLLDSWSDSQIKEWADKNGIKGTI